MQNPPCDRNFFVSKDTNFFWNLGLKSGHFRNLQIPKKIFLELLSHLNPPNYIRFVFLESHLGRYHLSGKIAAFFQKEVWKICGKLWISNSPLITTARSLHLWKECKVRRPCLGSKLYRNKNHQPLGKLFQCYCEGKWKAVALICRWSTWLKEFFGSTVQLEEIWMGILTKHIHKSFRTLW